MRKVSLETGEYYHVYNRGVDKRIIFSDEGDLDRFLLSLEEFNTIEPIGSIFEKFHSKKFGSETSKKDPETRLVEIVAYCLNPNHFHLLLKQVRDGGISAFLQRLCGGYTKYYNHRYKRSGVLFQGVFKSVHVSTNEYLLHLSAYINLNYRVHHLSFGSETSKLVKSRSSWEEYIKDNNAVPEICVKENVLGQFQNILEYKRFAENSLSGIIERRDISKKLEDLMLE